MPNLLWFSEVGIGDVASVGGKNASLGEMIRGLGDAGVRVPPGFATTAQAYRDFLLENRLDRPVAAKLAALREGKIPLAKAGKAIRGRILRARLSEALRADIATAYAQMADLAGVRDPAVAVRSSATAEDLAGASFAGQQETFLNVRGEAELLDACRRCFASLFTDRAISYRAIKGFDDRDVALSIGVQRMVRADLGCAGVMFTLDTETGFPRVVTISAAWGLGESVVQGLVEPDQYVIFKPLLERAADPVIGLKRGAKELKIVYGARGLGTRQVPTRRREREAWALTQEEVLTLARWGAAIEQHYGRPMDVEWAKDGESGELFILQARPETVHAGRSGGSFDVYRLTERSGELARGAAVGDRIGAGHACLIRSDEDLDRFRDGQVLVAEATRPDWLPVMKRAAAVVTDHGGTTSHAAIVSRELGLPAVVGTGDATAAIADGREITVCCAGGEKGIVYDRALPFVRERVDVSSLPATRTELMVNLANPETAFQYWRLPAMGVGLARIEIIIGAMIGVHPMAAAHPERLDGREAAALRRLSAGFATPADHFVDRLARGVAKLAAAYHPHPAIVRLSDFKSNEYANLLGGRIFEPIEENPMLGFRGASRYYSDRYGDGFALECRAIKRVREEMGFDNVVLMIPFCRTPHEADEVLLAMSRNGLKRGDRGLKIYMMCEIPSNVILAEAFAKRFDGFSIGSNDLTQLVLGVDRDSALLASLFDERDKAVCRMIEEVIAKAHAAGVRVGICGQAPSDHPDFAAFLVGEGIDSISLNPDSFVRTVRIVAEAEAGTRGRAAA